MKNFPYKIIDLTHSLYPDIPTWDGSCGFEHHLHHDYDSKAEYQFRTHKIAMNEGIGTHMDAPAHCIEDGNTIDALPLSALVSPCAVIDVSSIVHERYSLSVQDIETFEKKNSPIAPNSFVLVRTGWEMFWGQPEKYRNNHLFPSISKAAAELLLKRNISGIGIDTLSPDRAEDGFPVHKLLLGAGKYIVENAANLTLLPPSGSVIMVIPMKIRGGTEAPVRLLGLIEDRQR